MNRPVLSDGIPSASVTNVSQRINTITLDRMATRPRIGIYQFSEGEVESQSQVTSAKGYQSIRGRTKTAATTRRRVK